jgi:hypothetical protein
MHVDSEHCCGSHAMTLLVDDGGDGESITVAFEVPWELAAVLRTHAEASGQSLGEVLAPGIAELLGLSLAGGVIADPDEEA